MVSDALIGPEAHLKFRLNYATTFETIASY